MADFPRGWTYTNRTFGTAASITVAASPGVIHVLDAFSVKMVWQGAAGTAVEQQLLLSSSDGTFTNLTLADIITFSATADFPKDEATGTGLDLAAGVGASLTVAIGAVANMMEQLTIQGHDI